MAQKTSKGSLIDPAAYSDTTHALRILKGRLPDHSVATLAREVIGRLANQAPELSRDQRVSAIVDALVDPDPDVSFGLIEDLKANGASVETIYLQILAPAARRLGERWERDEVSFTEVTLGISRIYRLIRAMDEPALQPGRVDQPHAFFVSVPGEDHTLGLRMAADLFRRQGWEIELLWGLEHDAIMARFQASDHWCVGISAANGRALPALARLIVALRTERPGVRILVSGPVLTRFEEEVRAMLPDAVAHTFQEAFAAMTRLVRDWA